jgi:hypothetical protein
LPPGCWTECVGRARLARHDRQAAEIGNERVVAEARAALGDEHAGVAGAGDLGDDVLHVPGREELALLHIDGLAGLRRRHEKVRLAAEKGGDLENVDRLGRDRALILLVHVGEHRKPGRLADLGEDRQRLLEADPARAPGARAVRLVEGGLEDEPGAEPAGDPGERARAFERMGPAFELARPGDDRQPAPVGDFNGPARGFQRDDGVGAHAGSFAKTLPSAVNGPAGGERKAAGEERRLSKDP